MKMPFKIILPRDLRSKSNDFFSFSKIKSYTLKPSTSAFVSYQKSNV